MAIITVQTMGWLALIFMVLTAAIGKFLGKIKNGFKYHRIVGGLAILFAILHLLKVKGVF